MQKLWTFLFSDMLNKPLSNLPLILSCCCNNVNNLSNIVTKRGLLFYTDHRMKRDHKRRQIVATHAEERRVLESIIAAEGILPEQFR